MLLQNVRLSFPKIWKPEAFQADQKKKFGCNVIIPKDDPQLAALQEEIAEVAEASWGKKWKDIYKGLPEDKRGLRDGAVKADKEGYDDSVMFLAASNTSRPTIIDRDRTQLTEADGRPYAGCYVNANIEVWAQDNQFGKRINFSLRGLQFADDGESFGGGAAPADADEFPDLSGSEPVKATGTDGGSWLD